MDVRRLQVLLELSRLGSMHEVATALGQTTSGVSQAVAALAREAGTPLVEREGRGVRLTAAGHRLAEHAVRILAAVEAARRDLDPTATPAGVVRVAGFASAVRRSLLPGMADLAVEHPGVEVRIREHEPPEALALLDHDEIDLALVYDYDLAPASWGTGHDVLALWRVPWGLGLPTGERAEPLAAYGGRDWIVNSRNSADEDALRTLASLADVTPRVVHRVDALELVDELVAAGLGLALLPCDREPGPGVSVTPLADPGLHLRAYAVWRRGRDRWPPLRVLLEQLRRPEAAGVTTIAR